MVTYKIQGAAEILHCSNLLDFLTKVCNELNMFVFSSKVRLSEPNKRFKKVDEIDAILETFLYAFQ